VLSGHQFTLTISGFVWMLITMRYVMFITGLQLCQTESAVIFSSAFCPIDVATGIKVLKGPLL